jgi:hypothetical protein
VFKQEQSVFVVNDNAGRRVQDGKNETVMGPTARPSRSSER